MVSSPGARARSRSSSVAARRCVSPWLPALPARSASSRVSVGGALEIDELPLEGLPERVGRALEIAG